MNKKTNAMFDSLPLFFNAKVAKGMNAVFQCEIIGKTDSNWVISIKDDQCEIKKGTHSSPDISLQANSNTFSGIIIGEINSMEAFMSGKLKADGNISLIQKFQQIFSQR